MVNRMCSIIQSVGYYFESIKCLRRNITKMTLEEFYILAGGDYKEALCCLESEERIIKYLKKFSVTGISTKIRTALEQEEYETAFREAHNLKGLSLNLYLGHLAKAGSELTESLRNGPTPDVWELFKTAETEFLKVCDLIEQLDR